MKDKTTLIIGETIDGLRIPCLTFNSMDEGIYFLKKLKVFDFFEKHTKEDGVVEYETKEFIQDIFLDKEEGLSDFLSRFFIWVDIINLEYISLTLTEVRNGKPFIRWNFGEI